MRDATSFAAAHGAHRAFEIAHAQMIEDRVHLMIPRPPSETFAWSAIS